MKEKLSLHITKRSAHVLQWSKAIFLKVGDYIKTITRAKYLNRIIELSLLASFLNTTRKKLVTLDFSVKKKAYGIESIHSMITGTLFHFNSTNWNLFGRFYYPFIKKFHLFIRMKPMLSIFHNRKC